MSIFSDFIQPTRLKILEKLYYKPQTLTELSRALEISKPEVSRHLSAMKEIGLTETVEKNNELSPVGIILFELLLPVNFILENFNFFNTHPLIGIPSEFHRNLNALNNCEIISGPGNVLKKVAEFVAKTTDEVKIMVNQPVPSFIQNQILKAYLIIKPDFKIENLKYSKVHESFKSLEIRTYSPINLWIVILDNQRGILQLANRQGIVDGNYLVATEVPRGIELLNSIWEYYWTKANNCKVIF